MQGPWALHPLPRYVERNHRNGKLSFRVDRGARVPLPSDPTSPEFRGAYNAALVDAIAAEDDSDDWSELQRHHELQRITKLNDIERVERDLALCASLVLLEDPTLDPVVVPIFERLECDLKMLRTRDRMLDEDEPGPGVHSGGSPPTLIGPTGKKEKGPFSAGPFAVRESM